MDVRHRSMNEWTRKWARHARQTTKPINECVNEWVEWYERRKKKKEQWRERWLIESHTTNNLCWTLGGQLGGNPHINRTKNEIGRLWLCATLHLSIEYIHATHLMTTSLTLN